MKGVAMRSQLGTVYPDGEGRWRVQVTGPVNPTTGKPIRKSKTVRGSRREAERVKVAMLAEMGRTDAARGKMTLDGFWEDVYLPSCESRLAPTTVQGYVSHYDTHVMRALGCYELERITPAVVSAWLDGIEGDARKFEAWKILRQVLSSAVRRDLIDSNPCKRIRPPKKRKKPMEVLDAEDAQVYLWHYEHTPLGPLVMVAIGCGLTRSELCGLDWGDVRGQAVTVDNAVTTVHGRASDGATKNAYRTRTAYLPAPIAERLERLRRADSEPLCADSRGNRMNPDNVSKLYRRLQDGLPDGCARVCLKNLRHTSLTLAVESGADVYAVARQAGHASVNTTTAFYLKPDDRLQKSVAESMGNMF